MYCFRLLPSLISPTDIDPSRSHEEWYTIVLQVSLLSPAPFCAGDGYTGRLNPVLLFTSPIQLKPHPLPLPRPHFLARKSQILEKKQAILIAHLCEPIILLTGGACPCALRQSAGGGGAVMTEPAVPFSSPPPPPPPDSHTHTRHAQGYGHPSTCVLPPHHLHLKTITAVITFIVIEYYKRQHFLRNLITRRCEIGLRSYIFTALGSRTAGKARSALPQGTRVAASQAKAG